MITYPLLLEKFKNLLKSNTLKFTKQRELILQFLYENDEHYTPEDIYMLLKKDNPDINIGIATVYRTLTLLRKSKVLLLLSHLVRRVKSMNWDSKITMTILSVLKCGDIIEFFDETIEKQQEEIAAKFNFKMTDHTMKIVGLCEKCQD